MTFSRFFPILISVAILVLIAFVQERSKFLAAIIATMPVMIPLSLWVVYRSNQENYTQITLYARSLVWGIFPTVGFILAVWAAFRLRLPFQAVIGVGYAAWGILTLALRILSRGG